VSGREDPNWGVCKRVAWSKELEERSSELGDWKRGVNSGESGREESIVGSREERSL
jgi:hypothetical protein